MAADPCMGRGVRLIAGLMLVVVLAGSQAASAGSPRRLGDPAGSPVRQGAGSTPVHWQPYSQGMPSYAMVMAVAAQPPGGDIVYAGTYEPPGLWRSADRGASWQIDDRGLEGSPVYALHWDAVRGCWWATVWNLSRDLPATDEMGGYSLLAADGSPNPAYDAMADLLGGEPRGAFRDRNEHLPFLWPKAPQTEIPILAADEVVHLGDNQ